MGPPSCGKKSKVETSGTDWREQVTAEKVRKLAKAVRKLGKALHKG
jgi:hypothetical protein